MRRDITQSLIKLRKNNLNPHQLDISISSNLNVAGWLGEADPQDCIITYSVNIERYTDPEYENKIVIGKLEGYFINGYDYVNERLIDIRDVADALSGDLIVAVEPVTDEEGYILEEYIGNSILYIEELYIRPEYRGQGVGSLCFPMILDILGRDAGVITLIPCPTEDNGEERIAITDKRYNKKLNEMIKFFEKFGFRKINEEVWVQDTSLRN